MFFVKVVRRTFRISLGLLEIHVTEKIKGAMTSVVITIDNRS